MKNLPAGLENNTLEIYYHENHTRALLNGNRKDYLELPLALREPFQAELIADKKAHDFIREEWKIVDADLLEERFVGCRYGALNRTPDLIDGKPVPDAPSCESIYKCKGLGIVCLIPEGKCGKLSRQEFIVSKLVGLGKLDKEIGNQLNIELPTVRTYLNRIREKLCVNNRIEIANWVRNNGII